MATNPRSGRGRGGRGPSTTATHAPTTTTPTTPPATASASPAATAPATTAMTATTTTAAAASASTTAASPAGNSKKVTRLHIGPTGPWHDEDGNSCLIWTPRGYNVDDDAVQTNLHLVADRPFFLYEVGQPRPAIAQQSYDIQATKARATSHMIVVTTRGSMEIDVTVPSRRLSIENIRMPGAMRQSIALEVSMYTAAILLGLVFFGWSFVQIAGGVAGFVLLGTLLVGGFNAIRQWQRRRIWEALRWVFASDNRLWVVWMLMCLLATGVAVTHPGSGLIAPAIYEARQNAENVAHEERMQKLHNLSIGLGFKSDRELGKSVPEKPKPKDWGWFWVNAYFWMWWWIMVVPTFGDDVKAVSSRIWQRMWQNLGGEANLINFWSTFLTALRGQKITIPRRPGVEPTPATAGEIGSSVFWHSLSANLITELPSILHAIFRR